MVLWCAPDAITGLLLVLAELPYEPPYPKVGTAPEPIGAAAGGIF